MPAFARLHLLTPDGMLQERVEIEVGKGLRLDKVLSLLDKKTTAQEGFFRSVLKGRQVVTLLLNGERLDLEEDRKTEIHDGDELVVLSPITGG
jgi:molybdopterin converting factor small subunit